MNNKSTRISLITGKVIPRNVSHMSKQNQYAIRTRERAAQESYNATIWFEQEQRKHNAIRRQQRNNAIAKQRNNANREKKRQNAIREQQKQRRNAFFKPFKNAYSRVQNKTSRALNKTLKTATYYTNPHKYQKYYGNKPQFTRSSWLEKQTNKERVPINNINKAYLRYGKLNNSYNTRRRNILKQLNSLPIWNTRRHNRNPNKVAFMIFSGRI